MQRPQAFEQPFEHFHPENIPRAISTFRPDGQVPVLNPEPFDGDHCRVFKADFPDGDSWAIRIPLHFHNSSPESIIRLLESEVSALQYLSRNEFRWAPNLQACSLTFENSIGYPFIALSWIPGTLLAWSSEYPSRPIRDQILAQIALIHISLIEATKQTRRSIIEYYERLIDTKVRRIRNGQMQHADITEQSCLDQKAILCNVLYNELDDGLFTIDHGDISPRNIIVDDAYNVTGFINWGRASMVPFQAGAGFPRLLRPPRAILPIDSVLEADRKTYISSLTARSSPYASSTIVAWMAIIQSAEDVDLRETFLESIHNNGLHTWLALNEWKLPRRVES